MQKIDLTTVPILHYFDVHYAVTFLQPVSPVSAEILANLYFAYV